MDIMMLSKSDMEWLREIVQGKIAPVVMLTGFGSENIAVQSIHNGVIDYIPKDHHTKDRLWSTIKATLETWKRMQTEDDKKKLMYELKAKNTKQERFIYTLSHDLRAPLLAIRGFESMLHDDLKENGRERVVKDFYFIDNAAAKMEQLMDDSLQLSRIGHVANPPEDVPFYVYIYDLQMRCTKLSSMSSPLRDDFSGWN
ncbi:MAG: hypothetical protein N2V76_02075 [Methanophagales archaeon]|nr:hypothetical protein [Methanophagales archaeon]MCW3137211.1 hypothetical protein [Methanophagales archaeon]